MTTENIQDVVAERIEEFRKEYKSIERYSRIGQEDLLCDWLTTTLTQLVKEERQRVGEELMRLAEGEKLKVPNAEGTNPHWGRQQAICHNKAIDTLKKHITSLTGVK